MDPHWISSEIAKEKMRLKTMASRYRGEEKNSENSWIQLAS
jgi:hypothetical protein